MKPLAPIAHNGKLYAPVDVFYTLAQIYPQVHVAPNVHISPAFPAKTTVLHVDKSETGEMHLYGLYLYFDADGYFIFGGEFAHNGLRAEIEFEELANAGHAIMGPSLTAFDVTTTEILTKEIGEGKSRIYVYS